MEKRERERERERERGGGKVGLLGVSRGYDEQRSPLQMADVSLSGRRSSGREERLSLSPDLGQVTQGKVNLCPKRYACSYSRVEIYRRLEKVVEFKLGS